jgi:hypothetical protein
LVGKSAELLELVLNFCDCGLENFSHRLAVSKSSR